jgi:uridine kinase
MNNSAGSLLIGIAGETASGKTTFCERLVARAPRGSMSVLTLDSYYRSQSHLPVAEREKVNFDHPDAFDYPLLVEHVDRLRRGMTVDVPVYDFISHIRSCHTLEMAPARLVVVEGILTLHWEELRDRFDFKIFVDTPESVRLERRIDRDIRDRGRTRESVLRQWETSVSPMSKAFCAPTRQFADLVVRGEGWDEAIFDAVFEQATVPARK